MIQASRTAILVCQGRAAADGLIAAGRFRDPTAWLLLTPEEREPVQWVRDGAEPKPWSQRVDYETVRACADQMVARTVAIDDGLRTRVSPQVVILGAGLDGRAWRMPELAEATVFEVDQPASQADKRQRAAGLTGRAPVFVPVDFSQDRLSSALAEAGHDRSAATTWIWEGVVPYLTPEQVAATVAEIAAGSAPGSRLIVNYQVPSAGTNLGRMVARLLMRTAGRRSFWADEPWRSTWTPAAMAEMVTRQGFAPVADDSLLDLATALAVPIRRPGSLRNGRVLIADRG